MFFFSLDPLPHQNNERDEKLLALSLKDPRLFSILVTRYEAMLLRSARKILKNDDDARDAVQDTFVKIYAHADKFKEQEGASFKSWAFKILFNTCFSKYADVKKRRLLSVSIERDLMAEPAGKDESWRSEKMLNRDFLTRALSKLPDGMGKLLSLHYLEERPQKEIAEIMSLSPEAVRVRIHRAKKELKKITKNHV